MMSFRTRLTSFFVLIVVVPMAAVGFLVFRLIDDSQSGKADARASAVAGTAESLYVNSSTQASLRARTIAGDLALTPPANLDARTRGLLAQVGLARVTVSVGAVKMVDIGVHTAIAPGIALVKAARSRPARAVVASELTAGELTRDLDGAGIDVVVRSDGTTLASTRCRRPRVAPCRARAGRSRSATPRTRWSPRPSPGLTGPRLPSRSSPTLRSPGGSVGADRLLAGDLHRRVPDPGVLLLAAGLPRAARAAGPLPGRRPAAGRRRLLLVRADLGP